VLVASHRDNLCYDTLPSHSVDVDDQMDRHPDGLSGAGVRQAHVGRQYAMRKAREGLFGGVRVDCAQRALVAGVQCLQ